MNSDLRPTLIFLLKLLAFSPLLYLGQIYLDLTFLQGIIAVQVGNIMSVFGVESAVHGPSIFFTYEHIVSKDSTGWKSILFFSALVLSSGGGLKDKSWGLLLGISLIYLINLSRIVINSFAGFYGPEVFAIFHDVLWQLGMGVSVLLLWIGWSMLVSRSRV